MFDSQFLHFYNECSTQHACASSSIEFISLKSFCEATVMWWCTEHGPGKDKLVEQEVMCILLILFLESALPYCVTRTLRLQFQFFFFLQLSRCQCTLSLWKCRLWRHQSGDSRAEAVGPSVTRVRPNGSHGVACDSSGEGPGGRPSAAEPRSPPSRAGGFCLDTVGGGSQREESHPMHSCREPQWGRAPHFPPALPGEAASWLDTSVHSRAEERQAELQDNKRAIHTRRPSFQRLFHENNARSVTA